MTIKILLANFFVGLTLIFSETTAQAQVDISAASYPQRIDWSESGSSLNISSFAFQDRNRNGIYDIGDRAFAGIFVALGKDDQPVSAARTNVNGFANFKASLTNEDAVLTTVGAYEFVVIAPPGWYVSTENSAQTRELIEISGSIAGLGLTEMTRPVGLAPYAYVRGTVLDGESSKIEVLKDGVIVASGDILDDGQFLVPLEPGSYDLLVAAQILPITLGNFPLDIGSFVAGEPMDELAQTIDFDDLAKSGLQKIPNGYGGLEWFNLNALSAFFSDGSIGYQNGTFSGENIIYTSSGHPTEISRVGGFDFRSVMLTLAWTDAEGETAIFEFYRGEELVLTDKVSVSAFSPINYAPMMSDIDRVVIRSEHYWQLVLDDLVVSYPDQ